MFRISQELQIKKRRTITARDAAKKQHQAACDISNRSKYFTDQKLKNSIEGDNINVIFVRKLDTQAPERLLVGFAIQET